MADVFISYAKESRRLVEWLAAELGARGYSVWWDAGLVAGRSFRDAILRELDAARAVIVVWTPDSVASAWVISEAERAHALAKLIPVKVPELQPRHIPMPFGVLQTADVRDLRSIETALRNVFDDPTANMTDEEVTAELRRRGYRLPS